jgi:hypothetical protein
LSCPPSPAPPATNYTSSNGIEGKRFETKNGMNCVMPGEDVWFYFEALNVSNPGVRVGALGAIWCTNKPGGQCTQASWGDFEWRSPFADPLIGHEDHLNINTSGTYQVRLGICWLGSRTDCENNPSQWQYLSGPITIVIR